MFCGWYQIVFRDPVQPDASALNRANDRHPCSTLSNRVQISERKYMVLANKDWFRIKHIELFACGQALTVQQHTEVSGI